MPVGLGVGGIFVAVALIYLLAYLDLLNAASPERQAVKRTLIVSIAPLFVTFSGIVLFRTLAIL